MKRKIDDSVIDKRKQNKGCPQKLAKRDKRNILRQTQHIATSRDTMKELQVFYNKTTQSFCWRTDRFSDETVRRVLRANGFKYTHLRKKGVLSRKDLTIRLKFAKQVRNRLNPNV
jgi:hypothetical protein